MESLFHRIRRKITYLSEPETYSLEADEDCEVTDEIERALLALKEDLDLPTEEVERAIESRHAAKKNHE